MNFFSGFETKNWDEGTLAVLVRSSLTLLKATFGTFETEFSVKHFSLKCCITSKMGNQSIAFGTTRTKPLRKNSFFTQTEYFLKQKMV